MGDAVPLSDLQFSLLQGQGHDFLFGKTRFALACQKGHLENVRILLQDAQIDTNLADGYGVTPFSHACAHGHTHVVRALLECDRVNFNLPDFHKKTAFSWACTRGHFEVAKLLLSDERVDVNAVSSSGTTAFSCALQSANINLVKLMLDTERVLVNEPDTNGRTPFILSCITSGPQLVQMLLSHPRIDVSIVDAAGRSPFHFACGRQCVVHGLMADTRIDANLQDNTGLTPFSFLCGNGTADAVKVLLAEESTIDLHLTDYHGNSALFRACYHSRISIVKLLLEHHYTTRSDRDSSAGHISRRLNPFLRNKNGQTVLEYFLHCGFHWDDDLQGVRDTVQLLVNYWKSYVEEQQEQSRLEVQVFDSVYEWPPGLVTKHVLPQLAMKSSFYLFCNEQWVNMVHEKMDPDSNAILPQYWESVWNILRDYV